MKIPFDDSTRPRSQEVTSETARRHHLLFGEVRSVTTALKVVEEVQEEVQEIKDGGEEEEVERNGGLKVEEIRSSCDDHEMTRATQT